MTNTITELLNGNLKPITTLEKNNSELVELKILMEKNLDKLKSKLNDKEKEILYNYNLCVEEYLTVNIETAFYNGYSLGTKMLIDSLRN